MTTFITWLEGRERGPRIAVKDNIDVAGTVTTAGCRALERRAEAAAADAACLSGARAATARIVGKTNMDELAMMALGINPWFGTPPNPLDTSRIPGGSSSGSAVAVAAGDADIGIGTDTSGSVRVPAACCGVCGLKTTHGRVPNQGVWPLAPSLDCVGPLARDIAGLELGMRLLEPGFAAATAPAFRVGRVRTDGDPVVEAAVDSALREAGLSVVPVDLDLSDGDQASATIFFTESWEVDHELAEAEPDGVSGDVHRLLRQAPEYRPLRAAARRQQRRWRRALAAVFADVELLALPTLPGLPPTIDQAAEDPMRAVTQALRFTSAFNAGGNPCSAQPVPARGSHLPASLQLVGPRGGEELVIRTAAHIELACPMT